MSGSLESDNALYVQDEALKGSAAGYAASNNYLKISLSSKHLDAWLQEEYYPTPLCGFPSQLKGFSIPMAQVTLKTGGFNLTAGNFYEQYGSGLLLRSWEDRSLGLNNSIAGLRAAWSSSSNALKISTFAGHPRYLLSPSSSRVLGVDASLSAGPFVFEGSFTDHFYADDTALPQSVPGYSLRAKYSSGAFNVSLEHLSKAEDDCDGSGLKKGNAQIVEMGVNAGSFSSNVTLRHLSNMQQRLFRTDEASTLGNTISYIPALCHLQTYMLASLNPYVPVAEGEVGGAADCYYNFRKGTALGGKYGMKLYVGGSMFYTLPEALANWDVPRLAYRDINVEMEKRFSRKFKAILYMSIQESSPTHGDRFATVAQNVFVFDGLYRFPSGLSLRAETQYLYSCETDRDWMAALAEVNFAKHWSVCLSDMYNHGSTGIHYYDFTASFHKGTLRISAGYGRHRQGMVCSGGVCRYQPAYTGGSLQLHYSF